MPKVIKQTVRVINSRGDVQLSPDLVIAEVFTPSTIFGRKEIRLENYSPRGELRIWYPTPRSQSARIYLGRLIRQLGISPEDIVGQNYVGKVRSGAVHIFFDRKKGGNHENSTKSLGRPNGTRHR